MGQSWAALSSHLQLIFRAQEAQSKNQTKQHPTRSPSECNAGSHSSSHSDRSGLVAVRSCRCPVQNKRQRKVETWNLQVQAGPKMDKRCFQNDRRSQALCPGLLVRHKITVFYLIRAIRVRGAAVRTPHVAPGGSRTSHNTTNGQGHRLRSPSGPNGVVGGH